ncbi:MAG TPA: nicotinate (nicotinamide) nucleotide adenylyltransferase [Candidatus Saccharimonadia bacterium]
MNRIGLISGTFDPIHNGHIALATHAMDQLGLDEVLLLIDADPPHKPDVSDFEHRMAMAQLATQGYPRISPDKYALQRRTKNHTIATARELHEANPASELVLLMGADTFLSIDRWADREELFKLLSFGMAGRNGSDSLEVDALKWRLGDSAQALQCEVVTMPLTNISSSAIRTSVGLNEAISGLHPAVYDYIKNNRLY